MPNVTMPNGDVVFFPDDMPQDRIAALISSKFPNEVQNQLEKSGKADNPLAATGKMIWNAFASDFPQAFSGLKQQFSEGYTGDPDKLLSSIGPEFKIATTPAEATLDQQNLTRWAMGKLGIQPAGKFNFPSPEQAAQIEAYVKTPEGKAAAEAALKGRDPDFKPLGTSYDLVQKAKEAGQKERKDIEAGRIPVNVVPNSIIGAAESGVSSVVQMAPAIGASILFRNPLPAMAQAQLLTQGQSYGQARDQGLSPEQAGQYAILSGMAEGLPEALPVGLLLKSGAGPFLKEAGKQVLAEGFQESLTEMLQIGLDKGYISPDMTLSEAKSRLLTAVTAGALGGGVMHTAVHGPHAFMTPKPNETPDAGPSAVELDLNAPSPATNSVAPEALTLEQQAASTPTQQAKDPSANIIEQTKRLALPAPTLEDMAPSVAVTPPPVGETVREKQAVKTSQLLAAAREVTTPVGSFTPAEVGPTIAGKVNLWRLRTGRNIDAPITIADMQGAKVEQPAIDELVISRKPLTKIGSTQSAQQAGEISAQVNADLNEQRYNEALGAVRKAGRFTLRTVQDAIGATRPAEARAIRDQMVERGDLVQPKPNTFKLPEQPKTETTKAAATTATYTVAPAAPETVAVKKDGKIHGTYATQKEAAAAVRAIRAREKESGTQPGKVEIVNGGVDAEGKAMAGRPGYAVYENSYDEAGNVVGRNIVSTHATEEAAAGAARGLNMRPTKTATAKAEAKVTPDAPPRSAPSPSAPIMDVPDVIAGREQEIISGLDKLAKQRGLPTLGIKVKLVHSIVDEVTGQTTEGSYLNGVVRLALDKLNKDMTVEEIVDTLAEVMDHELIHGLRKAGVLAPGTKAWNILGDYIVRGKHPRTGLTFLQTAQLSPEEGGYSDMSPTIQVEEAMAEAFRHWAKNRRAVGGAPGTVFNQIARWFKNLVSSIPNDLFRAIETGSLVRANIKPPASKRAAAVDDMEAARAKAAAATTPEEAMAAQRELLRARDQAEADRVGRVGPRSVLGTTPSEEFMVGPRASFDTVDAVNEKAAALKLAPTPNYGTPNIGFMRKLADAYENAKHQPSDTAVFKTYSALQTEARSLFDALGVKVVPWRQAGQPYINQREMLDDIANKGEVKMRLSAEMFPEHPTRRHPMQEETSALAADGTALTHDDILRVVAEAYGYSPVGQVANEVGDYRAYHTIKGMFSDRAQKALATEMLAQSAWHNYGPRMRLDDGSIAPEGALGFVEPVKREFAERKATILPDEALVEPVQAEAEDISGITKYSRGVEAEEGIRYSRGVNKHGLAEYLRQKVNTDGMTLPPKAIFTQATTNANAQQQIDQITPVLNMFPDAVKSAKGWGRMMAYALADNDVPAAPYRLIKDLNDGTVLRNLKKMTPGQIADADHGFENAAKMRAAYTSGAADIDVTGKLFLWSFLSRGVSPYTQEGLFIDAFNGIEPWLNYAARGEWDPNHTERYRYGTPEQRQIVADYLNQNDMEKYAKAKADAEKKGKPFKELPPEKIVWSVNPDGTVNLTYKLWARLAAPAGLGLPGAGATHNLNAFGDDFLAKMSQPAGDGTGRSRLRVIHDMMGDPQSTGPAIRRKFMTMGEGVGIDNKVVSFTLLVAGFPDVMVLDRVQVRQLWNDGRFGDVNLYDGIKENNKPVTGTALADLTYGARGLLVYEAIERELGQRVNDIYAALGRSQDASIGRYHWDTWVTDSGQEASHGTLGAILPPQYGGDTLSAVTAKQGEYGSYAYGARYGVSGNGTSYFNYETPDGKTYIFTVPGFVEFQQELKKPGNKVVPQGFSVTGEKTDPATGQKIKEKFDGPWFTRPEVDTRRLAALAAKYAVGEAGTQPGSVRTSDGEQDISGGFAARPYPAQRELYSRGVKYGPAEQSRLPSRNRRAGRYALGNLAPLAGAPQVKGASGPDPRLVAVAEQYARDNGIDLRRQAEYVKVDPARAKRIADAYEAMPHAPQDPKVKAAYQELIRQTVAQYRALEKAGYKFWFIDLSTPEGQEYSASPWNAMRDIRANQSMGVFPTANGFGTQDNFSPDANPLLEDTGIRWPWGSPNGPVQPVLANDLFRAVHDAFGHGIEGSGFRAEGEENAWQAHVRLFTGDAVGAITSETRGQNSWLNYGPFGENNRNAKVEDTVFADQKTGLMPEWTWLEGRAGNMGEMTAANSYNVGSPQFYEMLDEVMPGGKYYGNPDRAAAAVVVPADTSAPNFSRDYDGNAFFGGDISYQQLQMARDGANGAVLTYMSPEAFLEVSDPQSVREQRLYNEAAGAGYKFNTMPSLVLEGGKVGVVPVKGSDGTAIARALVGKVNRMPVMLYPSNNGQIENILSVERDGKTAGINGIHEFDIERRGPREGLSTVAFNAWFKQSAVVDEAGEPKRMYHNTKAAESFGIFSTRSSEFGSHFGTVEQANDRVPEKGHGYPVYLSIQNPIRLEDRGEFEVIDVSRQLFDMGIIDRDQFDAVRNYTVNGMVMLQDILMEKGYDGVVYLNRREGIEVADYRDWNLPEDEFKAKYPEAQDSYIVFQPTQVKSAIANRGTWSAANPDIRYSRSRPRARVKSHGSLVYSAVHDKVDGKLGEFFRNLGRSKAGFSIKKQPFSIFDGRVATQDSFLSVKDMYGKLAKNGIITPTEIHAYAVEQSIGSKAEDQIKKREAEFVQPLLDAIGEGVKAKRFTYGEVQDFLYARHATERNNFLRSVGSKETDGSAMSDAEAAQIIADAKAKGTFAELTDIGRKVDDIVTDINMTRVRTGQITPAVAASSPFRHWVPLRDTDDVDPYDEISKAPRADGVGIGFTSFGVRPDKRMFGRKSRAGDIIANLISLQAVTVMRGERARVGKALYETLTTLPNAADILRDDLKILDKPPTKLAYGADGMIREIADPDFRSRPDIVVFKIDGREVVMQSKDLRLVNALKGPLVEQMGPILQLVSQAARFRASIITSRDPAFVLTNLSRDAIEAAVNSSQYDIPGLAARVIANIPRSAAAIAQYQLGKGETKGGEYREYYKEMKENGWIVSFLAPQDIRRIMQKIHRDVGVLTGVRGAVAKAGKAFDGFLEAWDGLNNVTEGGLRLAFYAELRKADASIADAGIAAKNLTINFNKGGTLKPVMNSLYLFSSVVMNSVATTGRMLTSKRGRRVLGGVIALGFLLDALNRALSDDDDENGIKDYDQLTEDELRRNLIFPTRYLWGQDIKLPVAVGPVGALFNFGRNLSRALDGVTNKRQPISPVASIWNAVMSTADALNPVGDSGRPANLIAPWFVDPFIDLQANKNWADMNIVPQTFDNTKPESQKYYRTTDDIYVNVAKGLNDLTGGNEVRGGWFDFSPEQYKYVADFLTGGTGRFLLDSAYAMGDARELWQAGRTDLIQTGRIPVLKRFVPTTAVERGGSDIYYKLSEEVQVTENELKSPDPETRAAGKARVAAKSSVRGAFNQAEAQLTALRAQLKAAQQNKTMNSTARLAKIEEIKNKMQDVMDKAVKRYYDTLEKTP